MGFCNAFNPSGGTYVLLRVVLGPNPSKNEIFVILKNSANVIGSKSSSSPSSAEGCSQTLTRLATFGPNSRFIIPGVNIMSSICAREGVRSGVVGGCCLAGVLRGVIRAIMSRIPVSAGGREMPNSFADQLSLPILTLLVAAVAWNSSNPAILLRDLILVAARGEPRNSGIPDSLFRRRCGGGG